MERFFGGRVRIPPLLISVTARPSDQRSHFMALERPRILMTLMMMTVMMMTLIVKTVMGALKKDHENDTKTVHW